MTRSKAAILMMLAMTAAALEAALAKALVSELPVIQVLTLRYLTMVLILLPGTRLEELRDQGTLAMRHAARVALMLVSMGCFYAALKVTPLASALALFYTYPFITLILAWLLFGARFGTREIAAVVIAFAGALLVLQPQQLGGSALLLAITVLCVGCRGALDRYLAIRGARPKTVQFITCTAAATCLAMLLVLTGGLSNLEPLQPVQIGGIVVLAVLACLAQVIVVTVVGAGQWSVYSTFGYWEVLVGLPLAIWFFGEHLDAPVLLGVGLVILAGLSVTLFKAKSA